MKLVKSSLLLLTVYLDGLAEDINQRIMLLENRLDGVMISFNATLAQNTNIRKEIDHLVGERSHFNEMIAKLQKKIAANKKAQFKFV